MEKVNCKKCWHFSPYWSDRFVGKLEAACFHPDCFGPEVRQEPHGDIVGVRSKDIIDFNRAGDCKRFCGFHYERKGFFRRKVKVKDSCE